MNDVLKKYLRRLSYGEQPRPSRDWLIVMGICGVLFIASVSWSYWIFYRVSVGESVGPGASVKAPLDAATIERVKQVFDGRAAERAHYQNDYRFVDPSH